MNFRERTAARLFVEQVIDQAAFAFGVPRRQLVGRSRFRGTARARLVTYWLAREVSEAGFTMIGQCFGERDHATVLAGCRRVDALVAARDLETMRMLEAFFAADEHRRAA